MSKHKELFVFLIVVAVAGFFRLYQLGSTPSGLYPDEAMNGNNAVQALETKDFKIFYPENNGREGLFINIQALSIWAFGAHPWSLRFVSALIGILTVIGLYLLVREMFEWRLAALAGFLLAVSFWHVNLSRIGFRTIMVPFILVYLFFFLWRGLKTNRFSNYFWAGIFGGLGFYTYISYRIAPLIAIAVFLNYWQFIKKDYSFAHSKYEYAKTRLLGGFALLAVTAIIVALPMGFDFWQNPDRFFAGERASVSVFAQDSPLKELGLSVIKTLGMFNFSGDFNQRHNIAGAPLFPWPIGIFFAIGFINELGHWLKRKHGHFSVTHTLIFVWFFIMLLPGFLSTEAPHVLRTVGVLPVAILLAAKGIAWVFDKLSDWHKATDSHEAANLYGQGHHPETKAVVALSLAIFLSSLAIFEFWRYFIVWGKDKTTAAAFNYNYLAVAKQLNQSPPNIKKYVLVNAPGIKVNGVSMPAQTIMFLTDTYTPAKQKAKNIYYMTEDQFKAGKYDRNATVIPLE